MKRIHVLFAVMLLALGATFALRSTHANTDEKENSTNKVEQLSNQLELIERIDALEQRIARLEGERQPIRVADIEDPYIDPQQSISQTRLESMPVPVPIGDEEDEDEMRYRGGARIIMHCVTPKQETNQPRTANR